MSQRQPCFDVFISYSQSARCWVQSWLLPRLESAGLHVCIDVRDFDLGVINLINIERAIMQSRHTLLILTPDWVASSWAGFEAAMAQAVDPAAQHRAILPLLLQPCQPPRRIAMLTYADFTQPQQHETQLQRVVDAIGGRLRLTDLGSPLHRLLPINRDAQADRSRAAMLNKVRTIWIDGVLNQNLTDETRIALALTEKADAVLWQRDFVVRHTRAAPRRLAPDTPIIDVFDDLDGALLILGAPGAGKTMLLLDLASALLDRAVHDAWHPIPVILPLSSWAEQPRPLQDWIVEELAKRYDVPYKLAQTWVAADQILPLLDGLDEVAAAQRSACIAAINAFRCERGFLPLVICCRAAEYDALPERLRLHGAIEVQPLTQQHVEAYLARAGQPLAALRVALHDDASLWELLDTPLMLNIMTLTYANQPAVALHASSLRERRDDLFAAYVARMLPPTEQKSYTHQQTLHWLSWLASQMQRHNQTVFYLERMQPDWLPHRQRWLVRGGFGLVYGLVYGLGAGLVVGLLLSLGYGPLAGLTYGLSAAILAGLGVGLGVGWVGGTALIEPVEALRWSWSRVYERRRSTTVEALLFGLLIGLFLYLFNGPIASLIGGVMGALLYALGVVVSNGYTRSQIETVLVPNQGINRSGRNALVVGVVSELCYGLIVGVGAGFTSGLVDVLINNFHYGLASGLVDGLGFGLVFGLGRALFSSLRHGGRAYLQHYTLRRLLVQAGIAPWRYVEFLDYAARLILLHKVGGGYIFVHRLLLDYFAARYTEQDRA